MCKTCDKLVPIHNLKAHSCNTRYCGTCKNFVPVDSWEKHCYIQQIVEKQVKKVKKLLLFDLECTQDRRMDDNKHGQVFEHEVMVVVVVVVVVDYYLI